MPYRADLPTFAAGEISDELKSRIDTARYRTGLARAVNVVVRKYGGITKRQGTQFVGRVRDNDDFHRLIPFQFSFEQTYALVFGQATMRPAALGGQVVEGELAIIGITNASNASVNIAYHGYEVGDDVVFSGVTGMTQINGKTGRVVSVTDANNFVVNLDSSGWGAFTGSTGGSTNVAPPPPPDPPPVVPPPVDPPEPPDTVGGGGYRPGYEEP